MKKTVVESAQVRLTLVTPPADLAPFISLYYVTEILPGHVVEDWLPPEGGNFRSGRASLYKASIGDGALRPVPAVILAGPTSRAARVRLGEGRFPGVGILPLGWAKFLGVPASAYADTFRDAADVPAMAPIAGMLGRWAESESGLDHDIAQLDQGFRALLDRPLPQADAIVALHSALVNDDGAPVAQIARELGVSTRTLERSCAAWFGFPPQLLLRRQRFLRSLAKFMVDPTMKWINSLDNQYHDQAHFLRDFKRFMMMRPSEFAARPHPIAMTAVKARRLTLADPMQVLHVPERFVEGPGETDAQRRFRRM